MGWIHYQTVDHPKREPQVGRGLFGGRVFLSQSLLRSGDRLACTRAGKGSKSNLQTAWFVLLSRTLVAHHFGQFNRPFAGSGHMVRNKLHWDAKNAVGLSKQRKVGLDR